MRHFKPTEHPIQNPYLKTFIWVGTQNDGIHLLNCSWTFYLQIFSMVNHGAGWSSIDESLRIICISTISHRLLLHYWSKNAEDIPKQVKRRLNYWRYQSSDSAVKHTWICNVNCLLNAGKFKVGGTAFPFYDWLFFVLTFRMILHRLHTGSTIRIVNFRAQRPHVVIVPFQ